MEHLIREGRHLRVCDPTWNDPTDTGFSKKNGGRWNPPGEFEALYLNASVLVAAANARRAYENEIATLFDLRPEMRPDLLLVSITQAAFVDVVTPSGLEALSLPNTYPVGASWEECRMIARAAHQAQEPGVACRSNADATAASYIGEELVVFDTALHLVDVGKRLGFSEWYPLEVASVREERNA